MQARVRNSLVFGALVLASSVPYFLLVDLVRRDLTVESTAVLATYVLGSCYLVARVSWALVGRHMRRYQFSGILASASIAIVFLALPALVLWLDPLMPGFPSFDLFMGSLLATFIALLSASILAYFFIDPWLPSENFVIAPARILFRLGAELARLLRALVHPVGPG